MMEMRVWDSTHKHILSLCVSVAFVISGTSALDLYTPAELYVLNGTTATLRCTFKSSELVNSMTSVEWFYQAEGDTQNPTPFFYFISGRSFPTGTLFKGRAEWAGDMNKRDASIRLLRMQFKDNGTFFCNVKVPPDISSLNAGTRLWVVESLPQTSTAVIAGGVISAVFGILILSLVLYFLIRRQEPDHHYEGCTSLESVSSQNTRPGKKAESSADNSRCPSPSAPVQGPVIYAQLDYSGTKNSSFHKMEPVVYADIRKN